MNRPYQKRSKRNTFQNKRPPRPRNRKKYAGGNNQRDYHRQRASKKSNHLKPAVEISYKSRHIDPCFCQGRAVDVEDMNLFNMYFDYEGYVPLPKVDLEGYYKYTVICDPPFVNAQESRLTMLRDFDGSVYEFCGFNIMSYYEIDQEVSFDIQDFEKVYHVRVLPVKTENEHIDIGVIEWFYRFMYQSYMNFGDWNKCTSRENPHEHGGKAFYLYPTFRNMEKGYLTLIKAKMIIEHMLKNPENVEEYLRNKMPHIFYNNQCNPGEESIQHVLGTIITNPAFNRYLRLDTIFLDRAGKVVCEHIPNTFESFSPKFRLVERKGRFQLLKYEKDPLVLEKRQQFDAASCFFGPLNADMCEMAMLMPFVVYNIRYSLACRCMDQYAKLDNRLLWKKAFTHPSMSKVYSNTSQICKEVVKYMGKYRFLKMNTKKRQDWIKNGVSNRYAQFAQANVHYIDYDLCINISDNQRYQKEFYTNYRLEFLGDAVLEFISSTHLFFIFQDADEGKLSQFRKVIVSNKIIATFSERLGAQQFAVHPWDEGIRSDSASMAGTLGDMFESILGVAYIFSSTGFDVVRSFLSEMIFNSDEQHLKEMWMAPQRHFLQNDYELTKGVSMYNGFRELVDSMGLEWNHIRLLAKCLTHSSLGGDKYKLGDNQRLEFLGDAVLEFVSSEYLYHEFPRCVEGQLTLLRNSLVNNTTIAEAAKQLGFGSHLRYTSSMVVNKEGRNRAYMNMLSDAFEAFLAGLFLDQGLDVTRCFANVVLFSKIPMIVQHQLWKNPKTKLITHLINEFGKSYVNFNLIKETGPAHEKEYTIEIRVKGRLISVGTGHTKNGAEMQASKNALRDRYGIKIKNYN